MKHLLQLGCKGITAILLQVTAWGFFCGSAATARAAIHHAPIIVHGFKIRSVTRYPIRSYRLFRTGPKGEAVAIPYQIDEVNQYGDYILDQGSDVTANDANGLFDLQDELVFMGDDVGPLKAPSKWKKKPSLVYQLRITRQVSADAAPEEGAVFVGIYFDRPPAPSKKKYVVFNKNSGEVVTSRYRYRFDQKNYLIVNGVDMVTGKKAGAVQYEPLLESSTFYMKADLKYFLTFEVNHRDINSFLDAYKVGPIRTIVRVTFFYSLLKINFELGMYTEVSLFSNSVVLPAVMYNPLDGKKSLNTGSGFYYGFAVTKNPKDYKIETNIPKYSKPSTGLFDFFKGAPKVEDNYWLSIAGKDRMMYFEITPSREMLAKGNIPLLYREDAAGTDLLKTRDNDKAAALGKSPVNMALHFDLTKFQEGEHRIAFRLFFDNVYDEKELALYKTLNQWRYTIDRIQ